MDESPVQKIENFDREKSIIREAYSLLAANTPLELSNNYSELDQELMHSKKWDYNNPDLGVNKVKKIIEEQYVELEGAEKEWAQEILWFWYHHAISCAISRYADREAAQLYSVKALELQIEDHPNQITRLLYLIVHDNVSDAEAWAETITEEPERSTAKDILEHHKAVGLFGKF